MEAARTAEDETTTRRFSFAMNWRLEGVGDITHLGQPRLLDAAVARPRENGGQEKLPRTMCCKPSNSRTRRSRRGG